MNLKDLILPLFATVTLVTCTNTPKQNEVKLVSGPMIGHTSMRSTTVWIQTENKSEIFVECVSPNGKVYSSKIVSTNENEANTATIEVGGLEPGTSYKAIVKSGDTELTDEFEINTQVLWDYRIDPPEFSILAGSCVFINDSIYDRPGKPYGGEYEIFETMAAEDASMMLWLGDNTYLREVDFQSYSGYLYRYSHTRQTPEMQNLLKAMPNYAILDDHDYGPNDADASWIHGDWARQAFESFWANPSYGAPAGAENLGTAFRYNDVEFFLLDNRSHRVHHYNETRDIQVLGEDQIDWLISAMNKSYAPFKVVALGGQFLSDVAKHENMARYPEREAIINRIEEERIHGVVFLTGDRHCTELSKLELDRGVVIHDLTVSPLTSSSYDNSKENNGNRVEGTVVAERNYAELTFSGPRKDRAMKIEIKNKVGETVWSKTLNAKDL